MLTIKDADNLICQDNIFHNIGASYKTIADGGISVISAYPFYEYYLNREVQFSYAPLYISEYVAQSLGIKGGFLTFEDIITTMPAILKLVLGGDFTLSMNGITEITQEEFYKI